jgi:hypothetical protein
MDISDYVLPEKDYKAIFHILEDLCDVGRFYARQVQGCFFQVISIYVSYTNIYDYQSFIIVVLSSNYEGTHSSSC